MPYIERDWPQSMADWDDGRLARHAIHMARWVAAGWRTETASINAHDDVIAEDEAERAHARKDAEDARHAAASALLSRVAAATGGRRR